MKSLICLVFCMFSICIVSSSSHATIQTRAIEYTDGDAVLEGYLAYDDDLHHKKMPGVLIVHEWMGLGSYEKGRAEQLAALGYVAFAADIYGKGIRPKDAKEAAEFAGRYRGGDRKVLRSRVNAALTALRNQLLVDPARTAAIGYCFGGTTVLELARSGADLLGVVSFHGGLATPEPTDAKNIKAKVLALHGGDDPFVKSDEVLAFQDEMRKANVDWQFVSYGHAVHSFSNPAAGNDNSKGAAYNEKADKRSWTAMRKFFKEIFGEK